MLAHRRHRPRHPLLALVEPDRRPGIVLLHGGVHRRRGLVMVDARGPLDLGAVDGGAVRSAEPARVHSPPIRLRMRSESNASGATCMHRRYVSAQDVPSLRTSDMAVSFPAGPQAPGAVAAAWVDPTG